MVVTPVGHRVEDVRGGWASGHAIRTFYWPDRWYSLLEVYAPDGRLEEAMGVANSWVAQGMPAVET